MILVLLFKKTAESINHYMCYIFYYFTHFLHVCLLSFRTISYKTNQSHLPPSFSLCRLQIGSMLALISKTIVRVFQFLKLFLCVKFVVFFLKLEIQYIFSTIMCKDMIFLKTFFFLFLSFCISVTKRLTKNQKFEKSKNVPNKPIN